MRHRKKINHLGRKAEHRKAMLSNLAVALIMNKRIKTTLPKAKALRQYIEPLITRAKEDTTHNRRIAFRYLKNKYAVSELFREIGKKVENRPGGYTRILKIGFRKGDGAEMAYIELVDYNDSYTQNPSASGERKRRTRRGGKKRQEVPQATEQKQEQTEEQLQQSQEDSVQEQTQQQLEKQEDSQTNIESDSKQEEVKEQEAENKDK